MGLERPPGRWVPIRRADAFLPSGAGTNEIPGCWLFPAEFRLLVVCNGPPAFLRLGNRGQFTQLNAASL